MNIINQHSKELLLNRIITSMSTIDWGKANARNNEIIQKDLLNHLGVKAWDPNEDKDCPKFEVKNNSPGFDLIVENVEGKFVRVQSKLRQVKGKTDFSQQTHFETTRRHSKKNTGEAVKSGHVSYSKDEFDYVMISLINVRNGPDIRSNVDKWSFAIIPINEILTESGECCLSHIPAKTLKKFEYKITSGSPPNFNILS